VASSGVTFDTRSLDRYIRDLQGLPQLQAQALNEATRTVRTDTGRKIRENTSAKAALVRNRLASAGGGGLVISKRASRNSLFTVITGSKLTTEMNKQYFSITARRGSSRRPPSATIKLKGRRVVFPRAQVTSSGKLRARGLYTGSNFKFIDDAAQRAPLVRLRTFSVRSQLDQAYITNTLDAVSFTAYRTAFIRAGRRKGLFR